MLICGTMSILAKEQVWRLACKWRNVDEAIVLLGCVTEGYPPGIEPYS